MFLKNKYTELYYKIIESARNFPVDGYKENHHIVPRSLNGSNDALNLVLLSPRQHFICHYLLTKMVEKETFYWYKMINAFTAMRMGRNNRPIYMNSRLFETAKLEAIEIIKNRVVSEETRRKKSLALRGKKKRPRTEAEKEHQRRMMTGKIHVPESIIKMKKSALKRDPKTREFLKTRNPFAYPEVAKRNADMRRGKIWICNSLIKKQIHPNDLNKYELEGWKRGMKW